MNAVHKVPRPVRVISTALTVVLVLVLLVASMPTSAQAASTTCASFYTIQEGDTTVSIAQSHGVKWGQIAKANKLKEPYRLKVGQVLCIPKGDGKDKDKDKDEDTVDTFDKATFTASVVGDRVLVYVAGLKSKNIFAVKVREVSPTYGEFHKLGLMKVDKNKKVSRYFDLPSALDNSTLINVCLKNATTDELTCRTIVNP